MTAICVPVFVRSGGAELEEMMADVEEALEGTRGMIELRCDTATPRLMLEAIEFAHLPVIVTVRPTWEGGTSDKNDEYRLGMFEAAIEAGVEFVDVELLTWERSKGIRDGLCEAAEKGGTRIILSHHCFEGRPKDLAARVSRLRRVKQADVLKIAWKGESILDGIEALRLAAQLRAEEKRPAVVLAMGEEGVISRLLAKKYGAPFTFAAMGGEMGSGLGQPTVEELRGRYRWEEQGADTPVFGVVGWPLGHSLSPHIHNAGFEAAGVEGVYVPLAVKGGAAEFKVAVEALAGVPGMQLRGLSVTIPHKESAYKYVHEKSGHVDELSRHIGVINTMEWTKDGVVGFNSDYAGALDALVSVWNGRRQDVDGKRIAVLGAGGAARAIVAGLVAHGATVVIYNRTPERAGALAAEFSVPAAVGEGGAAVAHSKVMAAEWGDLGNSTCGVFINCTPVGMHPKGEENPFNFEPLPPGWKSGETVVFDTVYNPPVTAFLRAAEEKGARIVTGGEMFVRQAAVQFRAFTGKEAPLEVFRRVMGEAGK